MELKDFQVAAIARLNAAMGERGRRDVVLKAPTGSGKTIILTHFMRDYMRDNPRAAFVWLTPGKGELEEQSKAKMDRYCPDASTKDLADVMVGGFAAGDAAFINWEKLTKKGSNALKDGERTNFIEWVEKARSEGVEFKVVVDESHQNFTEKADAIVSLFGTDKIVRASATPLADRTALLVEVGEADVIAEGLIKRRILINPEFPRQVALAADDADGTAYLLERALEKRTALAQAFVRLERPVNPLILVQLPNDSDAQLDEVEKWFAKRRIDVAGGTLAVWLAKRHDNLDGLADSDGRQVAVIIKQAVATGWDCPRAHILVKLRHNMDETFEIQTIGRIRRMPEAVHYGDDLLDSCYLYTFDTRFTEGVRRELGSRALDAKRLFLRPEHKAFALVKEQRTMVADGRDPVLALEAVAARLAAVYGAGVGGTRNRARLAAAGYDFRAEIWRHTQSGEAAEIGDFARGKGFSDVAFSQRLDTHGHGRPFHHVVAEVGAACGLRYEDCRKVVFRLFGAAGEGDGGRVLSLGVRELYAFVINNAQRLREDFRAAMAAGARAEGAGRAVSERPFRFPHEWVMAYDGALKVQQECVKNVYAGYLKSARPRSQGEVKFERWCEDCADVAWWYRNGDMGETFLSIVYADNAGRQRLFYPDYILGFGGATWIVEVKGGFTPSGQSENIDLYAEKKAAALKAYCARHGLRGGFVCHDAGDDALLVSEDGFSEDPKAPCWRLLDVV